MKVRCTRVVSIFGLGVLVMVLAAGAVSGQADPSATRPLTSISGKPAASFSGLTALDYIEIKQLAARYAYAVDTGAEDQDCLVKHADARHTVSHAPKHTSQKVGCPDGGRHQ